MNQIIINKDILRGKPVIRGTRIPVYLILNLLAHGYTHDRIVEAYPDLKHEDVIAALEYAEKRIRYDEEILPSIALA